MGGLDMPDTVPRRLSKPRTNTPSSVSISISAQQNKAVSLSPHAVQQDYFGDYAAVISSRGESRSRRKSRSRIRAYLHGSYNEDVCNSSDEDRGQKTITVSARDVKKRLSRTGSSLMQIQSAKTSTTRLSNASSSALLQSGSSEAEETNVVVDQIKERAHHDRLAAQSHIHSPGDEDKHVDSVKAPLRRKSLYTPGLATRNPSDILRKPPQSKKLECQPDHDYYYDPARPKESPLSQLAALQLSEDGRSTPSSDLQYAQLGGLQLGTLRVTNGAASPIPGSHAEVLHQNSDSIETRRQEECYAMSDGILMGGHCPSTQSSAEGTLQQSHADDTTSVEVGSENSTSHGSPSLTVNDRAASMALEYISEFGGGPFTRSNASAPHVAKDAESVLAQRIPGNDQTDSSIDMRSLLNDDADTRYVDCMTQEDALRKLSGCTRTPRHGRPLSFSRYVDSSECIHRNISNTECGNDSSISSSAQCTQPINRLSQRQAATRIDEAVPFTHKVRALDAHYPMSKTYDGNHNHATLVPNSAPLAQQSPTCYCPEPRRMPQPEIDQHENLTRSLDPAMGRSFSVFPRTENGPIRPTVDSSVEITPGTSPRRLTRKLQKSRPKSQPPPMTVAGDEFRDLARIQIPQVPIIVAARHADRLRQFPLLDHTYPSSQHVSAWDVDSSHQVDNYPIRFPSPADALEAASDEVPITFGNADRRRESRWRRNRSRTEEDHDASSIVRSPSWSDFGNGKERREERRKSKSIREEEKRAIKEEKAMRKRSDKDRKDLEKQVRKRDEKQRSRSVSRTRGRLFTRSIRQAATGPISDFGTVTESLGANPYDIATTMTPGVVKDSRNRHPHQISSINSRTRSKPRADDADTPSNSPSRSQMRGREYKRSSQLERSSESTWGRRSRDFNTSNVFQGSPLQVLPVPALAAVDLKAHELDWSSHRPRSQSSEAKISQCSPFYAGPDLRTRMTRPQSIMNDAPPVPALPLFHQEKQQIVEATDSLPQSIIIDAHSAPATTSLQRDGPVDQPNLAQNTYSKPAQLKAKKLVPDLWSHGSLEKKGHKSLDIARKDVYSDAKHLNDEVDNVWAAQRQAWSERRKSAGEALLQIQIGVSGGGLQASQSVLPEQKNQSPLGIFTTTSIESPGSSYTQTPRELPASAITPIASSHDPPVQHAPQNASSFYRAADRPVSYHEPATHRVSQHAPRPAIDTREAALSLQDQSPNPTQKSPSPPRRGSQISIPRKRVGSRTSVPMETFKHLSGRYQGGLRFGYEPGCGLGGSAGTRSTKTLASRKSLDVSRGWGLDLSDVPVFLASTQAH